MKKKYINILYDFNCIQKTLKYKIKLLTMAIFS